LLLPAFIFLTAEKAKAKEPLLQRSSQMLTFIKNIKMEKGKFRNYHSKEFYNEILFESESFIVIPTLGSLVEGWLLIVPKNEYLSLQCIDSDSLLSELEELSQSVGEFVVKEFGYVTMFEHGAVQPKSTVGCGVDFAHLHLVPINFNLLEGVEKFLDIKYEWKKVSSLKDAIKTSEKGTEYLFLTDHLGNSLITQSEKIQSQLFRKVIAYFLEVPEKFDWKKFHETENVFKTISRFRKYHSSIKLKEIEHEPIR
jgi:ATP adenylyltransferase